MADQEKCPVDHKALKACSGDVCPVDQGAHGASAEQCPVDHTTKSSWSSIFSSKPGTPGSSSRPLPTDRETSTIPRVDGSKWVYPSQAQFYAAMERKNHNPHATDMKVVVPIHNAVNERTWAEVMKWEDGQGGDKCGGLKLVSFKGRPNDRTPRARWRMLLGCVNFLRNLHALFSFYSRYTPPFDRHDWIVDRCGTRMRYVIDFYTGHNGSAASNNVSFYLDVRPALDSWEGVRLRAQRFWERWTGRIRSPSTPPEQAKTHS